jgi:serine/threonine protein phosphatase 1
MQHVVFGDIHGFSTVAKLAVNFAEDNQILPIFLGDYVDKGPESIETLLILSSASAKNPDWTFIMGNHDKMLLDLINGFVHPDGLDLRTQNESLPSYRSLGSNERKFIYEFLNNLKAFKESKNFIFLHGGFLAPVSKPLADRDLEELVWTYGITDEYQGKKVIRGHDPTSEVVFTHNSININTQCGYGGFLTGLVVDDDDGSIIRQIKILETGEIIF